MSEGGGSSKRSRGGDESVHSFHSVHSEVSHVDVEVFDSWYNGIAMFSKNYDDSTPADDIYLGFLDNPCSVDFYSLAIMPTKIMQEAHSKARLEETRAMEIMVDDADRLKHAQSEIERLEPIEQQAKDEAAKAEAKLLEITTELDANIRVKTVSTAKINACTKAQRNYAAACKMFDYILNTPEEHRIFGKSTATLPWIRRVLKIETWADIEQQKDKDNHWVIVNVLSIHGMLKNPAFKALWLTHKDKYWRERNLSSAYLATGKRSTPKMMVRLADYLDIPVPDSALILAGYMVPGIPRDVVLPRVAEDQQETSWGGLEQTSNEQLIAEMKRRGISM